MPALNHPKIDHKEVKEDKEKLAQEKVLELTPCPLDSGFSCCLKSAQIAKMNSAVQLNTRNRVMSLSRVSCCFISWQCLMRISTDPCGPISIIASPQAASAGSVCPISFCPMAAGLNSVKGSVNWLVLKKAVYH